VYSITQKGTTVFVHIAVLSGKGREKKGGGESPRKYLANLLFRFEKGEELSHRDKPKAEESEKTRGGKKKGRRNLKGNILISLRASRLILMEGKKEGEGKKTMATQVARLKANTEDSEPNQRRSGEREREEGEKGREEPGKLRQLAIHCPLIKSPQQRKKKRGKRGRRGKKMGKCLASSSSPDIRLLRRGGAVSHRLDTYAAFE